MKKLILILSVVTLSFIWSFYNNISYSQSAPAPLAAPAPTIDTTVAAPVTAPVGSTDTVAKPPGKSCANSTPNCDGYCLDIAGNASTQPCLKKVDAMNNITCECAWKCEKASVATDKDGNRSCPYKCVQKDGKTIDDDSDCKIKKSILGAGTTCCCKPKPKPGTAVVASDDDCDCEDCDPLPTPTPTDTETTTEIPLSPL